MSRKPREHSDLKRKDARAIPVRPRLSGSVWAKAAAALALCAAIAACQPIERMSALSKAVLAQIFGLDYQESVRFSHESETLMKGLAAPERAFSAQYVDSEWHFRPRDERRYFVIGSVILKPKGIAPAETADDDTGGGLVRPQSASRSGVRLDPLAREAARNARLKARRAEFAAMRGRMQDRLARMGLRGASVEFNDRGEMEIRIAEPPGGFHFRRHDPGRSGLAAAIAPKLTAAGPTPSATAEPGPATPAAGDRSRTAPDLRSPDIPPGRPGRLRRHIRPIALAETAMDSVLTNVAANEEVKCPGAVVAADDLADPALATDCLWKAMRDSGDFEYCDKNYIFRVALESWARVRKPKIPAPAAGATPSVNAPAAGTPNDPLFALQWDLHSAADAKNPGDAGFVDFWSKRAVKGDRRVVVAVIDTGLDFSHPDFKNSLNLARDPVDPSKMGGFDFVSDPEMANDGDGRDADANDPGDKCSPNDPNDEDSFHGTHVAGTIGAGASNNGLGIAGGAWNVTIVPVRAVGRCGGQLRDINDAIRYSAGLQPGIDQQGVEHWINAAHRRADIINLSLGLFEACPDSMQAAIDDANAAGSIIVVAAGNDRIDTQFYAPAGCKNVVVVAASDSQGHIAPYSNFGANVALMAPGGDLSQDANGDGQPDGILSTEISHRACVDPVAANASNADVAACYYGFKEGTSMAAPHVSAALALLAAAAPGRSAGDYVALLKTKAARPLASAQMCTGPCIHYSHATPLPGEDKKPEDQRMCALACGAGTLDLSRAVGVR